MNAKFKDLPEEKQLRIINAGLEIFGQFDYRHASTDDIAARAGISKGLLFYYFRNKQEFYLYLYDYCADYFRRKVIDAHFAEITDFFELLEYGARIKYSIVAEFPYLMEFIMKAYYSQKEEVSDAMAGRVEATMSEVFSLYFGKIDLTRFRDGVDPVYVFKMLAWMAEGYLSQQMRGAKKMDLDEMMQEFQRWEQAFKKIAYKEEYIHGGN